MATLTNTQISVTYVGLLKTSANTVLTSTAQQITDGDGNNSILFLSTAGVGIGGSPASGKELDVTGNVKITGDLIIDNITIDGSTITNASGDLTIVNTADNGNIIFQTDDASGGVETYFFLDGANTSGNPITLFPDNSRAAFGNAEDLYIYHDPSIGSVIEESGAGDLFIETNQAIKFRKTGTSELMAKMTPDDAVELYHNNDIKFATGNSGVNVQSTGQATLTVTHLPSSADFAIRVDSNGKAKLSYSSGGFELDNQANAVFSLDSTGNATFVENVSLLDSKKLKIGTGEDLQIYHDGSDSYIQDTGTGDLRIDASKLRVRKSDGSETLIIATEDAGVELFHNDSKKFETTAGGVSITGTIDSTGTISVTGASSNIKVGTDTGKIMAGASNDLQIYHDGSDSYIDQVGTGNLNIRNTTDDKDINFLCDDGSGGLATYFRVDGSAVETRFLKSTLHFDNVKAKFGDSGDLEIVHDGSTSFIKDTGTGNLEIWADGGHILKSGDGTETKAQFLTNEGVQLYYDNSKKFETTSTGATVTGDLLVDGGDLTLGTDSLASNVNAVGDVLSLVVDSNGNTSGTPNIQFKVGSDTELTINGTTATFAGDLNISEKIIHSGDTNTFIQFPSTNDKIVFSTNGTDHLTLDAVPNAQFAGDVSLADSKTLKIGTGNDLQLSHNGSNSFITNFTGNLTITNETNDGDIIFKSDDGSGGTATYFALDGGITRTVVYKNFNFQDSVKLEMGTGADLQIFHNGSNSSIQNQTGDLNIFTDSGDMFIYNNATDGDISFQSDDGSGGTTEYFRLDGGETKTIFSKNIKVSSGSTQIVANFNASNSSTSTNNGGAIVEIQNTDSTNGNQSSIIFRDSNNNASSAIFGYNADHSDGEGFLTFGTRNSSGSFGERMRISSAGNVQFNSYGAGTLVTDSSGNITASSDSSLKTEVNEKISGLDEILQLQPRAYYWNKDKNKNVEFGFFADEVKDAIPEAAPKHKDGTYGLLDRGIIAALVNSIQELQQEIEILKSK